MRYQERRTSPRLEVVDQLHGQLVTWNVRQTLRELGSGGFSTEGPILFPKGAQHLFRFITAGGVQVVLQAAVAHCRPAGDFQDVPSYITGFSFVQDGSADVAVKIEVLLAAMTDCLTFEEDAAVVGG
jgi:hypothetical protein